MVDGHWLTPRQLKFLWIARAFRHAGANACPPEDVGGPPGYEDFLAAIRDPAHEEHDAMLEWCDGAFEPTAFDLEAANETLRQFKL